MKGRRFLDASKALEWALANRGRAICFDWGTLDGIRCTEDCRWEYRAAIDGPLRSVWVPAGTSLAVMCDGRDLWEWVDESEAEKRLKAVEKEVAEIRELVRKG